MKPSRTLSSASATTPRTGNGRGLTAVLLTAAMSLTAVGCQGTRSAKVDPAGASGATAAAPDSAAQRELREIKAAYAALHDQLREREQAQAPPAEALVGGGPVLDGVAWVGPHAGMAGGPASDAAPATVAMASYAPAPTLEPLQVEPTAAPIDVEAATNAGPALAEAGLDEVVERAATLLSGGSLHNAGARVERGVAAVGLSLLDPAHAFRTDLLDGLNTEEQASVHRLHRVVTEMTDGLVANDITPLANAEASIFSNAGDAELPSLTIAGLHLCKKVSGFGVFDPFESTRFTAGRPHRMIVYAEVEDFTAQQVQTDDGSRYRVGLSQEVILYNDADGLVVWRDGPREVNDQSRRQRRDFWVVQMITLPANLGVGKYRFKVRISDELGETIDEKTLPLSLVTDASTPAAEPTDAATIAAAPAAPSDASPAEDDLPDNASDALRLIRGLVK